MTESKPCPFCGSRMVFIDTLYYPNGKPAKFRAQCQGCYVATRWHDGREQAWADWNRREDIPKKCGRKPKQAAKPEPKRPRGRPRKEG